MDNDVLLGAAFEGDQEARTELLIRNIMATDEISHEIASTVLDDMADFNQVRERKRAKEKEREKEREKENETERETRREKQEREKQERERERERERVLVIP